MQTRIIVTGASGRLGGELVRAFGASGAAVVSLAKADVDITHPDAVERIASLRPTVVVNAAAWTDVDGCARDPDRADRINAAGAALVARGAARAGARIVQISSNEVFDGTAERPYRENDSPNPINPYGASKYRGELLVADATSDHLIVRTAWLFGPQGDSFVTKIRAAATASQPGVPLRVVENEWGNPTWIPALADTIAALATSDVRGILHVAGQPAASRFGWAQVILAGSSTVIEPIPSAAHERTSRAPLRAVLNTETARGYGIPEIDWRSYFTAPTPAQVGGA